MSTPNRRKDDMAEELEEAPKKGKPWLIPVVVALALGIGGTIAVTQNDALRETIGLAPTAAAATVASFDENINTYVLDSAEAGYSCEGTDATLAVEPTVSIRVVAP